VTFSTKSWTAVQKCVSRHVADGHVTGAVTGVLHDGELLVDASGVADADPNFKLSKESIFSVWSLTKPLTAACALQLVAEGSVKLSDPVSRYIPEFAQPRTVRKLRGENHQVSSPQDEPQYDHVPLERPLTVHDFLSFTSGLQTIMVPNADLPPVLPTDSIGSWVAKLGTVPLEFQPGTQWHYSNTTGYEVIARIIEVASGKTFAAYARERIFEPLGMVDTCFGRPAEKIDRVVPLAGMFAEAPIVRNDFTSGSGGLFTSLSDYAAFAGLLLNQGRSGAKQLLDPSVIVQMRRPQIGGLPFPGVRAIQYAAPGPQAPSGFTYGYGVAVLIDPSRTDTTLPSGSFGWDGIGTRRLWIVPDKQLALILFATGFGPAADDLQRELEAIIASA
jgi:CubicO group peptidase (beta-lactamase class C family)